MAVFRPLSAVMSRDTRLLVAKERLLVPVGKEVEFVLFKRHWMSQNIDCYICCLFFLTEIKKK